VIRFHIAPVNFSDSPFQWVEAQRYLHWYKLPKNVTLQEKSSDKVLCSHCKHLITDLECQKKKSSLVSPGKRIKQQSASSNYPVKHLSLTSIKKQKENAQAERSKDKALLSKFSKLDITLDDSQHDEIN